MHGHLRLRRQGRAGWALIAACLLCWPGVASAVDDEPPVRDWAATFSPVHLIFPVGEISLERRIGDDFSAAVIAGVGQINVRFEDGVTGGLLAWELGAQGRWYLLGSFQEGLHLGAELLYLRLIGEEFSEGDVTAASDATMVGPLIGYKLVTDLGFTLDAQAGGQVAWLRGDLRSSSGERDSGAEVILVPLLNLNIGWSF